MEERQVTVDGVTRSVPRPFLVIATQNPIELEGTFPLPKRSSIASCCAWQSATRTPKKNAKCCAASARLIRWRTEARRCR